MSKSVRRGIVISVLILSFIGGAFAQERKQELATVQQLKAEAVNAVLQGKFSQTNDLLKSAAASMRDPLVTQMAGWISQFEKQRTDFASERHVQYEKAVADVRKLLDAGLGTYAIDAAARAFLLADDKAKFRAEQWVDDLVKSTAAMRSEEHTSELQSRLHLVCRLLLEKKKKLLIKQKLSSDFQISLI